MNRSPQLLLKASLPALLATAVQAQFTIESRVTPGGGGSSTGTRFSVTGSIGQHDASNALQGPAYAVGGGFWHAVVPTPGAPDLEVRRHPFTGVVRVSWRDPEGKYELEQSSGPNALAAGSWSTIAGPYPVAGAVFIHEIATPTGSSFFRLREVAPP